MENFYTVVGVYGITMLLGLPLLIIFDKARNKSVNPRQIANRAILKLLQEQVESQPDSRFGQILRNTGVVVDVGIRDSSKPDWETPDYYWERGIHEEPWHTLARMYRDIAEIRVQQAGSAIQQWKK
jgi:hypothetical protein